MTKRKLRLWQLAGLLAVAAAARLYAGRKPKALPAAKNASDNHSQEDRP